MAKWRRGHRSGHLGPLAQAWGAYLDQEQAMAAVSERANAWRTGTPEPGVLVEVWTWLAVQTAVWDGDSWRTPGPDGAVLRYISHWRPMADNGGE